ncbi:putative cytosolic protein [Smithella sp. ME-1]|uniref:Cytoplasmic protein n=1 Tax=hydrocarbon metagenome TaxID=938273 RepID=A0A0W8FPH8_9ZZZZ|nr:putative cytosolic protein [Smithella sp. ME-1]
MIHIIPVNKLSAKALKGLIEEFITRGGTDYGAVEAALETKFKQVKNKLKDGSAVLVFDDETETTNILLADDPILKKVKGEE